MQLSIGLTTLCCIVLGYAVAESSHFEEDYTNKILFNKISKTLNEDDIRCYCNLPKCVTTNYMCRTARSTNGGCFSEIRDYNDHDQVPRLRGCVELLQDDKENKTEIKCDNNPRKHNEKDTNTDILVLCCQADMCNEEKPIFTGGVGSGNSVNSKKNATLNVDDNAHVASLYGGHGGHDSASSTIISHTTPSDYSEIWFTIATIAVPIVGTVIVVLLIVLAIRILKTDTMDHPSSKLNGADDHIGGGGCGGILVMSGGNSCRKNPLDFDQTYKYQSNLSPLLSGDGAVDNLYYHQQPANNCGAAATASQNNNSNRKNAELAKRNQLKSLEYNLLPQSCNDPNIKLTNTEDGVVNETYSKNFNNLNQQLQLHGGGVGVGDVGCMRNNYNNNKESKIYSKDVLNPVAANWK